MILIKLIVKGYITTQMRKVRNYYFSITDYIPATTLRGAILNEYYQQKGKIDEDFYVSPAYPLKTVPAHYFSPATQRKGAEFREEKEVLKKKDEEFVQGKEIKEILKLDVKAKPKIGTLITFSDEKEGQNVYTAKGSESVVLMHVAIDKNSGASRKGMLFAYEYKHFDELWALASDSSDVIDVVKRVRVGRSRNRVSKYVEVEKVKDVSLDELKDGLSYCLSPCVLSLFGKEFFKAKRIIGDTSTYSGWFTNDKFGGQKPVFTTLKEGSLVYLEGGNNNMNDKIKRAGLNFMFKIADLKSLLDRVSP